MASPLDSFVSTNTGGNDVRLPAVPKLREMIDDAGFKEGITKFDAAMENWRQQVERIFNERLQGKPAGVSAGNV